MSETNSANATRRPAELRVSLAVGALLALVAAATWLGSALAQQKEKLPGLLPGQQIGLAHDQRQSAATRERSWSGDF